MRVGWLHDQPGYVGGAELTITLVSGEVLLERWNGRRWARDMPPAQVRARNLRNVVSLDLHVRVLGSLYQRVVARVTGDGDAASAEDEAGREEAAEPGD